VSGAGLGFLALPEGEQSYAIRLRWDLTRLAPGAVATSSLGDGDVDVTGTLDQLRLSWFMAGPVRRYPASGAVDGFSAAWLGDPPFDAPALMAWSAEAHRAIRVFFGDSVSPFRFFLRMSPEQFASGGAALGNAFMLGLPVQHHADADLRNTVAHETVHRFAQGIDGPPGTTSWFSEGLATWYARRIPFEAGIIPAAEFLDDLNGTAARYYSNPRRTIPNAQVPVDFWKDRNAQIVPYDRGSIYFATVDAAIQARSNGARRLDGVLLPVLARARRGESISADDWRNLVRAEQGEAGVALFDSVIVEGREIVAPSDAYGPCFAREAITVGLFDLGFDELNSLRTAPRVIKGLRPGSSAERAGLHEGDEVLMNDDLNDLRPRPEASLHLAVRRGRDTIAVRYLPRRGQVPAYRWHSQPCPGRP
jgi:predicted metalloprotease with PDZ domain